MTSHTPSLGRWQPQLAERAVRQLPEPLFWGSTGGRLPELLAEDDRPIKTTSYNLDDIQTEPT